MINFEPVFEKVKYNALDYIGLYQAPVSSLSSILSAVVEQNGADIFFDTAALSQAMQSAGAEEAEIHRVCLMTQVTGFRELMQQDPRTVQLDLDRYILNATDETGLTRDTILRITSAIAFAVGIAMSYESKPSKNKANTTETVAALSYTIYQEQLSAFRTDFMAVRAQSHRNPQLDFNALEPLVNIGIPKAKYYLGYCLLHGLQLEPNEARGVALLQEAADAGDSEAASALGDYHFAQGGSTHWSKAYDYYTGFGAAALTNTRRKAIASILNHKAYNKKFLALCIVLFLALVATVIWTPASTLFAPRFFWGWFAVVIQLALLVLQILHYRVKPYDCIFALPVAMSGVWFLYMVIRILF